jgi:hypothetical protein
MVWFQDLKEADVAMHLLDREAFVWKEMQKKGSAVISLCLNTKEMTQAVQR